MNNKILLISPSAELAHEQISHLREFVDQGDKLLLGIGEESWQQMDSLSMYLPFKIYALSWTALNSPNLPQILQRANHLRKKSAQVLLKETSFLDFIFLPRHALKEALANPFIKTVLEEVRCPVLLFDEKQEEFKELFLSYNGEEISFQSIKYFTYLFQERYEESNLHLVLRVNENSLDSENCVYDYLHARKKNFAISRFFSEDYDDGIEQMLSKSESALLVCGGDRIKNLEKFLLFSEQQKQAISLFLL
ncbi:MAG: DUF4350 domain-containing protein [Bacteroidetes bacterium]|nr:MAG: DUF4350 domain-containing protein [Bacteroidota bacterium]